MFNPRERSRPNTFLAVLLVACLLLSGIARATPSITLSKKSGPPTSKILVSGRGFKSHVGVDIFFDTKDKALVVTNGKGEFHDARIHAPRSAHPGEHWVTALERNNDKGAQKPFRVQTNWTQFHFDADGSRLNPYENVLNPRSVKNSPGLPVGDVVISIDTALRQAREYRVSPSSRLRRLLIHGFLHLIGYDHERSAADARRMFARERTLATKIAVRRVARRKVAL